MIYVYQGSDRKKVHSIDAPAWLQQGWTLESQSATPVKKVKSSKKLAINQASLKELTEIKEIGEVTAKEAKKHELSSTNS